MKTGRPGLPAPTPRCTRPRTKGAIARSSIGPDEPSLRRARLKPGETRFSDLLPVCALAQSLASSCNQAVAGNGCPGETHDRIDRDDLKPGLLHGQIFAYRT